ncbi:MAG: site-specific integrase [Thermomicrobiales bacterium]|nr:site-specific integrase [Thermomicrobiales bacterium]
MAVYKRAGSPYYQYEFEHRGSRLRRSTGCKSKREAQEFERQKRQEAAKESERREALGRAPLTWGVAATRYWEEAGQHHAPDTKTLPSLEWLTRHIGEATPLTLIDGSLVARLVAKRRSNGVGPATVNRTVTEPLRRVLNRAKLWGESVSMLEWGKHLLKEPRERVRELRVDEEEALFAALREDHHAIIRFALLTGCRRAECVGLTWPDIDWGGRLIWINGKGGKRASIPLPPSVRELLWPLRADHPESVFTYSARHAGHDVRKGERRPITYRGMETEFMRALKRAGIRDFSFHDLRHTAATRVLRATGNLNIVKRMLRHENIRTTVKYAHSQHDDVLAGMEAAAEAQRVPTISTHRDRSSEAKAKC